MEPYPQNRKGLPAISKRGTSRYGKGPAPASTKRTHAERGTDEKGGREFRKRSFRSILQRRSKVRLCPESVDISGHELRLHSDAFRSGSDATARSPWLLISQPPPSRSRLAGQRRLGSPKGKRSGWPSAAGTALWLSPRCVYEGGFPSTERSCASLWASGGRPPSYSPRVASSQPKAAARVRRANPLRVRATAIHSPKLLGVGNGSYPSHWMMAGMKRAPTSVRFFSQFTSDILSTRSTLATSRWS